MPFVTHKNPEYFKHNVLEYPPSYNSFASLILLKQEYFRNERKNGLVYFWTDAVEFSRRYLNKVLEQKGSLTCYLCNKENLLVTTKNKKCLATVDHFIPTSAGGNRFNEENLRVACSPCNSKKGNKIIME